MLLENEILSLKVGCDPMKSLGPGTAYHPAPVGIRQGGTATAAETDLYHGARAEKGFVQWLQPGPTKQNVERKIHVKGD